MTLLPGIKKFKHPTYTAAEWANLNPYLERGIVGFETDVNNKTIAMKVGPGYWNDLEYLGEGFYPYSDLVTNEIGDVLLGTNQYGRNLSAIINEMISPFAPSAVSGAQNDAQGSFKAAATVEVGNSVSGVVNIVFSVSNQENLYSGGDNLNIFAGGLFSEEGWQVFSSGEMALTLINPLAPAYNQSFNIAIKVKHEEGESAVANTLINFMPRIIWGNSPETSLSGVEFASISFYNQVLSNSYKSDYPFSGTNYHYIGIPDMLDPLNVVFTDVTNPDAPAGISMEDLGLLNVPNGVGTYDYRIYRTTFDLLNPVIIRIA